jgi:hypothetical protein
MTFYPDWCPWGIPAIPEDPPDVFKRRHPATGFPGWAQPIEMTQGCFPEPDDHRLSTGEPPPYIQSLGCIGANGPVYRHAW